MDATKKEIAEKLVNSNTLGLKEMAGTIMSELEKNEKVKEVVVRVRVVRLPKGQKNNTNNNKCKAKVSTLSYKFNVNQKNLHKLLLKRRQQLLSSSKNAAANMPSKTNPVSTVTTGTSSTSSQNQVATFEQSRMVEVVNEPQEQQTPNSNEWPHEHNANTLHSTANLNSATSSPLSTTTFSAFSSSPRDRSSFYGNIMSPVSHENSPSAAAAAAPLQNQQLRSPHDIHAGNFDGSSSYSNNFYRFDSSEDPWSLPADVTMQSSITSYSSTWPSTTDGGGFSFQQQQQQQQQLQQQRHHQNVSSSFSRNNSRTTTTNYEMAHLPNNYSDYNRNNYSIPFGYFGQQQPQEGKTRHKPDLDSPP